MHSFMINDESEMYRMQQLNVHIFVYGSFVCILLYHNKTLIAVTDWCGNPLFSNIEFRCSGNTNFQ